MPLSEQQRADWEQRCFGCTQSASRDGINQLVEKTMTHGHAPATALAHILSDAQELIDLGSLDKARQYLNRVKDALYHASPFELWGFDPDWINTRSECMDSIAKAARDNGIDIYERPKK